MAINYHHEITKLLSEMSRDNLYMFNLIKISYYFGKINYFPSNVCNIKFINWSDDNKNIVILLMPILFDKIYKKNLVDYEHLISFFGLLISHIEGVCNIDLWYDLQINLYKNDWNKVFNSIYDKIKLNDICRNLKYVWQIKNENRLQNLIDNLEIQIDNMNFEKYVINWNKVIEDFNEYCEILCYIN